MQMLFLRAVLLMLSLLAIMSFTPAFAEDEAGSTGHTSKLTPLPGNPLRTAVLDALRDEVKRLYRMDVVFVVRHLKVKEGWAWAHTQPQSSDGQQRYEDMSALLNLQDGVWRVVELPCTEVDNPECLDGPNYFAGLVRRFEQAPAEIFPAWAEGVNER